MIDPGFHGIGVAAVVHVDEAFPMRLIFRARDRGPGVEPVLPIGGISKSTRDRAADQVFHPERRAGDLARAGHHRFPGQLGAVNARTKRLLKIDHGHQGAP